MAGLFCLVYAFVFSLSVTCFHDDVFLQYKGRQGQGAYYYMTLGMLYIILGSDLVERSAFGGPDLPEMRGCQSADLFKLAG